MHPEFDDLCKAEVLSVFLKLNSVIGKRLISLIVRDVAFALVLLCAGFLGCASSLQASSSADYGFEETPARAVWMRGPWKAIEPSKDIDEVIDQLCPAIMSLPGARDGDYGREYCGVVYQLVNEKQYYASSPSPLTEPTLSAVGKLYEREGKVWKLVGYILPEDKGTGHVSSSAQ